MSIQRTATFQRYGIKPSFDDTLSIPGALPIFSSDRTIQIRVSGSTSATKSLSLSVSVTLSWSESNDVK